MQKLFLLCVCLLLAVPCEAEIIYVDDDGPADFNNIQDAINYSSDGDIIEVQRGTYYENVYFYGKAVTLTSTNPNDPNIVDQTIIDGNQADSVLTFAWVEDVNSVVTGFTIRNGSALYGSGVCCWESSPTISNNVITANGYEDYHAKGGGIYCYLSSAYIYGNRIYNNWINGENAWGGGIFYINSSPSIIANIISCNEQATRGGGISCQDSKHGKIAHNVISHHSTRRNGAGIYCLDSAPLIFDNDIVRNISGGYGGAGITSIRSSPQIISNRIMYNSALSNGPGAGIYISDTKLGEIVDNLICQNTSPGSYGHGGGIYCYKSETPIQHNTICGNIVKLDGGGIFCDGASPSITNNVIIGNTAVTSGGGICLVQGSSNNEESSPYIIGNTISSNSAAEWGGGIFFGENCAPSIKNNIITNNESGGGIYWKYTSPTEFLYNCLYSNVDGDYVGWATPSLGDILADPCFVQQGYWDSNGTPTNTTDDFWVDGDYHLQSMSGRWDANIQSWVQDEVDSTCIDAGDPNSDWTAELWPHGKRINMGAYGGTPEASMSALEVGDIADLNNDDIVDFRDFAYVAGSYQTKGILLYEDLNRDNKVNGIDLYIFVSNWLLEE